MLNSFRFDMKGHPSAADLVASGSSLANNQVPGNIADQARSVRKVNTVLKEVVADAAPSEPMGAAPIEGGLWVSVSRRTGVHTLAPDGGLLVLRCLGGVPAHSGRGELPSKVRPVLVWKCGGGREGDEGDCIRWQRQHL